MPEKIIDKKLVDEMHVIKNKHVLDITDLSEIYEFTNQEIIQNFKRYKYNTKFSKNFDKEKILENLKNEFLENKEFFEILKKDNVTMLDIQRKYKISKSFIRTILRESLTNDEYKKLINKMKKNLTIQTNLEKYGTEYSFQNEDVKNKVKKTNLERYGAENVLGKNSKLKKEIDKKLFENHGVRNVFQLDDVKKKVKKYRDENKDAIFNKMKETNLKKYGVEFPLQSKEIWQKINKSNEKKYGVTTKTRAEKIKDIIIYIEKDEKLKSLFSFWLENFDLNSQNIQLMSNLLANNIIDIYEKYYELYNEKDEFPDGYLFNIVKKDIKASDVINLFNKGLITKKIKSLGEVKIANFLENNDINFSLNDRKLLKDTNMHGKELDFYLPDYNIAFEINPNYTHNSNKYRLPFFGEIKDKNYHFNKYLAAQEKNIKLIQLYSNDLDDNILFSKTLPRIETILNINCLNLGARQTKIIKVNTKRDIKDCREFLNKYHTQGATKASIYYQLRHKNTNELLTVVSFGKPMSKSYENSLEIKRICFKNNIRIRGAISKIIKQFFREHDVESLITYSDNNFGDGKGYEKVGFKFVKETGPSLKYIAFENPTDVYSWSINTPWGATSGVVGKDRKLKNLPTYDKKPFDIEEYIETELTHRNGEGKGYDVIYTAGSKLWKIDRKFFKI